jgi:transposase InsO family protein
MASSTNTTNTDSPNSTTPPAPNTVTATNSTPPTFTFPNVTTFVYVKLEGPNYHMWLSQFLPVLRLHDLMGIVEGTEPCPPQFLLDDQGHVTLSVNPDFSIWTKKDQSILSWINATLTEKVLSMVYGLNTSRQVWAYLATKFALQSRSRIAHLKRQLQHLHQGSQSCSDFLQSAKLLADQLAIVGKPVDEDDLISYVISGLNASYGPFITSISVATRNLSMSFEDFQAELLSHELFLENHNNSIPPGNTSFALLSNKKPTSSPFHRKSRGSFSNTQRRDARFSHQQTRQHAPPRASPAGPLQSGSAAPRAPCQICGKTSHQALDCYHRMDYTFQGRHPPSQLAAMISQNNSLMDDNWYADSGANAHITADLDKLSLQQPFNGQDTVAVGNGSGLQIQNTGSTFLQTPHSKLLLTRVLHCPQAAANLLSINRFCLDNDCFFILTGTYFLIKANRTGKTILKGPSVNGLYPINLQSCPLNKSNSCIALLGVSASFDIWHARLGHASSAVVSRVLRTSQLPVSSHPNKNSVCEFCQYGKSKQLPFPSSSRITTSPLELVHSDVWMSPSLSLGGSRYYVIFIDDFSRFCWVYPLVQKSDVFISFVKFKALVENQLCTRIKQFQSDNGGEFVSKVFSDFLALHGILHRRSCPHTAQQNGLAERKHRHLMEMGLSLLAQSHLPTLFWADAFLHSAYIINRLPTPLLSNESPYSKLFHRPPNYSLFRIFGCAAYPLLRPYLPHKLSFRSKQCIFLGFSPHHKGYRCLDPVTNHVYLSRNVVFDETLFPVQQRSSLSPSTGTPAPTPSPVVIQLPAAFPPASTTLAPATSNPSPTTIPHSPGSSGSGFPNQLSTAHVSPLQVAPHNPSTQDSPLQVAPEAPFTQPASLPASHQMVTRSKTGSLRPRNYADFQLFYSTRHPLKALHSTLLSEPTCFSEASKSPSWRAAMNQEFDALLTQNTWSLCPLPAGRHAVRNKWVYKLKQQPDGSIERYKARLVAKGFDQRSGIDYTETFSPVIKPATVRVVLAIAVHFNWSIRQLDISNAFLHGKLQEEVYMLQPQGFVHPDFPNHVCKLHKAIYGLKQAPRAWFNRLSDSLLEFGFTQSRVDTSLFLFHQGAVHLFILIYVDDILITGTHNTVIQSLLAKLRSDFALKDLGELSYFLGIQVQRTATSLHLRQSKYILDLLHKARMVGAKASRSPCVTGSKLSSTDGTPLENVTEFRQLVGGLQYCTLTRPEIAYSVNQLCQHLHSPTSTHWTALKRVLRYLKGSVDHGLFYSQGPLTLQAYCDSDWAGDPDDRRSTTGYGVFLGPCLISWCAKKQSVVARSSTEAEYRAMALATTELYWIRMLLRDLQLPLPAPPAIRCDNLGAMALATNPIYHARTKHIEVDYHFIPSIHGQTSSIKHQSS